MLLPFDGRGADDGEARGQGGDRDRGDQRARRGGGPAHGRGRRGGSGHGAERGARPDGRRVHRAGRRCGPLPAPRRDRRGCLAGDGGRRDGGARPPRHPLQQRRHHPGRAHRRGDARDLAADHGGQRRRRLPRHAQRDPRHARERGRLHHQHVVGARHGRHGAPRRLHRVQGRGALLHQVRGAGMRPRRQRRPRQLHPPPPSSRRR